MLYIKSVQILAGAQRLAQHTSSKTSACRSNTVSSSNTMPGRHSALYHNTDCTLESTVDGMCPVLRLQAGVMRETDKYYVEKN